MFYINQGNTNMRKLASIRKISQIKPIDGADAIEVAVVDGWNVVVKRGEFSIDDLAVYLEIDSWVPYDIAPFLSRGQEPHVYNNVKGERLRTVRLRGVVSQGLLLNRLVVLDKVGEIFEGMDVSELLGIQKWEATISAALAGQVKGAFPAWIRKTDQERCQNLVKEIFEENADAKYEVTLKLDGTSATFYHYDGEVGVCSRNLDLKISDENKDNTLVKLLFDTQLNIDLPNLGNIAIQGEVMGPGIQGNRENLKSHHLFVFDIYLIDESRYASAEERKKMFDDLMIKNKGGGHMSHVPTLGDAVELKSDLGINNIYDLLKFADGKSLTNNVREGVVFKRTDGKFSFKAISNQFLLKGGN